MPKMTKIVSVSLCSVSQELCIIWLGFLVPMSKMIISPVIFLILKGVKNAKSDLKLQISVHHAQCLRNCRSYQDFWYADVK